MSGVLGAAMLAAAAGGFVPYGATMFGRYNPPTGPRGGARHVWTHSAEEDFERARARRARRAAKLARVVAAGGFRSSGQG